jgi:hypothetical protein
MHSSLDEHLYEINYKCASRKHGSVNAPLAFSPENLLAVNKWQ